MNQITLLGRLGHDPSLKTLPSGVDVVEFSLATNHSRKQGDEWVKETTWHRLKMFGTRAKVIKQYVKKGDNLLVVGRQENGKYQDKDGVTKPTSEVIVSEFELLSNRAGDSVEAKDAVNTDTTWKTPVVDKVVKNYAPGASNPPELSVTEDLPF